MLSLSSIPVYDLQILPVQFQTAFFMAMGQSTRVLIFQILWGYPMCNLVLWWLHLHIYSQPINVYQPRNLWKKNTSGGSFGQVIELVNWFLFDKPLPQRLLWGSVTCDAYRMRFASNSRGVQCASTVQLQSGIVYQYIMSFVVLKHHLTCFEMVSLWPWKLFITDSQILTIMVFMNDDYSFGLNLWSDITLYFLAEGSMEASQWLEVVRNTSLQSDPNRQYVTLAIGLQIL